MKHLIKNKHGMTLIEVLAVTVITSIVAILVFSIIQSSLKQQSQQTKEASNLNDITYALKMITKDIRRSTNAEIKDEKLELTFPNTSEPITYSYSADDKQLKKGIGEKVEIIIDGLGCAEFSGINVISIKLSNTSNCSEGPSTEIHLRKGS